MSLGKIRNRLIIDAYVRNVQCGHLRSRLTPQAPENTILHQLQEAGIGPSTVVVSISRIEYPAFAFFSGQDIRFFMPIFHLLHQNRNVRLDIFMDIGFDPSLKTAYALQYRMRSYSNSVS